jgi:hypothetical protein
LGVSGGKGWIKNPRVINFKLDHFDTFNNFAYCYDNFENIKNMGVWGLREGVPMSPGGPKFKI